MPSARSVLAILDSRRGPPARGRRHAAVRGFTLVEIMIVVTIIALLAAILIANFTHLMGYGRAKTLSSTVSYVREVVEYRAAAKAEPLTATGYPTEIDASWFSKGQLPVHTWTSKPMIIETVDAGPDAKYPENKTFDVDANGAANAWYNTANGAFCVLVSDEHVGQDLIDEFNAANIATITDAGQTE